MFVIPMVGLSSRFFKEGYKVPKYQLPLHGTTVFSHVIESFLHYFESDTFIFLCRTDYNAQSFITSELARIGVRNYVLVPFDRDTRGQAETVYLGIRDLAPNEELYIFNIDTFRPCFRKPTFVTECDGYLEVFRGDGEHWSFVLPSNNDNVLRTTEKDRVSDLCSDGLYYFKRKADFDAIFEAAVKEQDTVKGEYYVAPLYNRMIKAGKTIKYHLIAPDEVVFCGTPSEYEACVVTEHYIRNKK
ncbi:glycosyltransferase family 2 protein [Noviherbaspirillum sedimenti]|uniref:Capsular biosynthesis protein n=1 Tax=Noviherbaspirillum sedimenti TaxID=2320865 RepID=A0A3A3G5I9_9BURK|nr:glycosyltransferase family 2 protein [Noviherbaspirillum sedimenti]RJG02039.1 capsular biosynthesis protein [Noviherbaspirillum sedimenti]